MAQHDDTNDPHHDHDELIGAPRRAHVHGPAGHTHSHGGHAHSHDYPDHSHPHDHAAHEHSRAAHFHGDDAADPSLRPHSPRAELAPGAGAGKLLHLDCFSGLSGDMIVGALLDLGVPRAPIQRALDALSLTGYSVDAADKSVNAIVATKFLVRIDAPQPHRTYRDVKAMLDAAALDAPVRARAQRAFHALAIAEGRVHRVSPEEVHFHEVGAVDAIVDIVAASAALEWLGARVSCAPLPMGRGFTKSEHGVIPLPAPAVVELLVGIPTEDAKIDFELVTPTGAALVRANATEFSRWPSMRPIATGFGAGTRTLRDRPNMLRVVLGDPTAGINATAGGAGSLVVLEANLDDATGEAVAHATEALFAAGALDAWTVPIGMKKSRPGVMLCAVAQAPDGERLARVMMSESTTLGVRVRACDRVVRPRRMVEVETAYGRVPVKVADGDGLPVSAKPEDAVVSALAREKGVAVKVVHAAAVAAYWEGAGRAQD